MKTYCRFQRDLLPKNGKDMLVISVILIVIIKNYLSVAIYKSLVTNKTVTSYSSAYQAPYDSLGECPVVVDQSIIFGWMQRSMYLYTTIYYKASFYLYLKC